MLLNEPKSFGRLEKALDDKSSINDHWCERDDHWEDLHPINLPEALQWRHLSYYWKPPTARKAKPYINHTRPQAKVREIIIHSITNQLAFFP